MAQHDPISLQLQANLQAHLQEHSVVFEQLVNQLPQIETVAHNIIETLRRRGKLLLAGNGGSAADAQHIAAEFSGRYLVEREALAAIALTTDTSALTAIGNDYGFERVFARQFEALAQPGDVLWVYSTSGNSGNIIEVVKAAKALGCYTVALTGATGGLLRDLVDDCVCVPSTSTPRIQEAHAFIGHEICDIVDKAFAP